MKGESPTQNKIPEEEKSTDYWVPSSASPSQPSPVLEKDFDEHIQELGKPLPRMGDTMIDDSSPAVDGDPPQSEVKVSLAEIKADLTTVEMTPEEAAAKIAEMTASLAGGGAAPSEPEDLDTVEMTPEEASAMLAEMTARARAMDAQGPTATFDGPTIPEGQAAEQSGAKEAHFECRICGMEVDAPRPVHFRGPISSRRGFHCEKCSIVVCAKHTVRTSGFIASLFGPGRFSCQLCQPFRAEK